MRHSAPGPVDEALVKLIAAHSDNTVSLLGDARVEVMQPVVLNPDPKHAHDGEKYVTLLALKKNDGTQLDVHEGIALIQRALGSVPVIAQVFNGLKPRQTLAQQVASLAGQFPANDSEGRELHNVLAAWEGTNAKGPKQKYGPHLDGATVGPLILDFDFANKEHALSGLNNLKARSDAIVAQIVADAQKSNYLTPEQKEQIKQLTVTVEEKEAHPGDFQVQLRFGLPTGKAGPDGRVQLTASPLNTLTEHAEANVSSSWQTLVRHWAVFAGEKTNEQGTGWQNGMPLLAGNDEMQRYISNQIDPQNANAVKDPNLQAALKNLLTNEHFVKSAALDERDKHAKVDFKLTPPNPPQFPTYRLRLTLPEGMTQQYIENSIVEAASAIQQPAAATDAVPAKPAVGPHTAALQPAANDTMPMKPVMGNATQMIAGKAAAANDPAALARGA